jgi:hypothetical protein
MPDSPKELLSMRQWTLSALALGAIAGVVWWGSGNIPEHGILGPPEVIASNQEQNPSEALSDDLQRASGSAGVSRISSEVLEEVSSIARRKIFDEGGLDRSLDLLEQLHKNLVESGKDAPFQRSLNELLRFDGALLPTDESLWQMSVESMEIAREVLMAHANWIREYSLQPSTRDLDSTRLKMADRPLFFPPEAIAMAITRRPWADLVEENPALPVSLGRIREQILVQFGEKYTEIWCIQSLVYQAVIESNAEIQGNNEKGTLLDALGKLYAPLGELSQELEALPISYLQAIESELLVSGLIQDP